MGIAIFDRLPHSVLLLLLGVVLVLLRSFKSAAHTGGCLPSEWSALLDLIRGVSFGGPPVSWKPGSNCCDWEGVTCDPKSGHVIGLNLSQRRINGTLSGSLFSLTSLQTLDLSDNEFEGDFPQVGFENLTQLTRLNLASAGFSGGQIPIGISRLTDLVSLDLSSNYAELRHPSFRTLVGNLSSLRELCLDFVNMSSNLDWGSALSVSIPHLQVLSLSGCDLPGLLPTNLFTSHANLTLLDLTSNPMLSGNLPDFPNNNALRSLRFSETNLSGKIPDSISNLKYLTSLHISECGLTGMIPSSIGNLTQLTSLGFFEMKLSGNIPDSISNLKYLATLVISGCGFTGMIPSSIGNFQVTYLNLSGNEFTGAVPSSIGNIFRLSVLDLHSNNFTGLIPTSIGNLTQLTSVDLHSNHLSGSVPVSLFTHPALELLDLSYNQFSGELKEFSNPSMSLDDLDLSNNQLQGHIPISLFKLSALNSLDLSSNNFNGTVELGNLRNLTNLKALDLSRNNRLSVQEVSGINYSDTFPNLISLHLASCNLIKVPAFLRYQHELRYLGLSDNKIGGGIPEWIWGLDEGFYLNLSMNKFTHFEGPHILRWKHGDGANPPALDLHSNSLRGPLFLPSMSFQLIDYSNNNISSVIPSNISSYLFVCNHLLLRNNNLIGEIPTSICKAHNLLFLDLSGNSLSGSILRAYLISNLLLS